MFQLWVYVPALEVSCGIINKFWTEKDFIITGCSLVLRQVIAQSLVYGKNAYFDSGWNIMDGSLVIISFVDILMSLLATTSPRIFGILRVFRLLRALRPLRWIAFSCRQHTTHTQKFCSLADALTHITWDSPQKVCSRINDVLIC